VTAAIPEHTLTFCHDNGRGMRPTALHPARMSGEQRMTFKRVWLALSAPSTPRR
jgi:hypothetical protein